MNNDIFENRAEAWREISKKGKAHYLVSRAKTGIVIGFAISFLREFMRNGVDLANIFTFDFLLSLLNSVVIFPVVFVLLGLYLWGRNEKLYNREEDSST